ncbi:unnamed protein product [Calicophoron daubneyi]|uniref:Chromo domain-containing protein n=1 Tax=Calicophoron daubneyi TaxID=300641 RepID=A0AAV2U1M7_CALDB
MASLGEKSMRKQLRACRRRHRRRIAVKAHAAPAVSHITPTTSTCVSAVQDPDSEAVYLVEDIRGERIIKGQKYYKVRWQGFPPESDSWEPEENLSNVLDIINSYHQRIAGQKIDLKDSLKDYPSGSSNSPASLPTPPPTPASLSFSGEKRSRGASEERQAESSISKRKHAVKSRTSGRYEYVPKHQLVASKTKYFDDIRDGKIDLSSNDLYSRVKTRRRCTESSSVVTITDRIHSISDSSRGEVKHEDDSGTGPSECSIKHEPNSPTSDSYNTGGSPSGFQSTVDSADSDHPRPNVSEQIESLGESLQSLSQCYSVTDLGPPMVSDPHDHGCVSPVPSASVSCSSCFTLPHPTKDEALSPIIFSADAKTHSKCYHTADVEEKSEPGDPNLSKEIRGPSANSLHEVVKEYFELISNSQKKTSTFNQTSASGVEHSSATLSFDNLSQLQNYASSRRMTTAPGLLDAIDNQRWGQLDAAVNYWIEKFEHTRMHASAPNPGHKPAVLVRSSEVNLTSPSNSAEDESSSQGEQYSLPKELLIAALISAAERPVALERLLSFGLDPDTLIGEPPKWPLLILAVRLHRLYAAQCLLDAGAKPNCTEPGPRRRSALGLAIVTGDVDMATMLILSGANFYEVETGTTALSFIMKLLNAYSSFSNPSSKLLPIPMAELQDKLRCNAGSVVPAPIPSPPSGVDVPSVPNALVLSAVLNSTSNNSFASSLSSQSPLSQILHFKSPSCLSPNDSPSIPLPSVDSLKRIYDTVAVHHARLSVKVASLVRNWLARAGLVQVGLLSPCQWISVRQRTASVQFTWPSNAQSTKTHRSSRLTAPILLLIHGRIVPPACYDLWMDEDGPCLIARVLLDQNHPQKPLGCHPFVTTIFPLPWNSTKPHNHQITIDFLPSASSTRPVCVAVIVVNVAQSVESNDNYSASTTQLRTSSVCAQSTRLPHSGRVSS